jgi:hypothetical protein
VAAGRNAGVNPRVAGREQACGGPVRMLIPTSRANRRPLLAPSTTVSPADWSMRLRLVFSTAAIRMDSNGPGTSALWPCQVLIADLSAYPNPTVRNAYEMCKNVELRLLNDCAGSSGGSPSKTIHNVRIFGHLLSRAVVCCHKPRRVGDCLRRRTRFPGRRRACGAPWRVLRSVSAAHL